MQAHSPISQSGPVNPTEAQSQTKAPNWLLGIARQLAPFRQGFGLHGPETKLHYAAFIFLAYLYTPCKRLNERNEIPAVPIICSWHLMPWNPGLHAQLKVLAIRREHTPRPLHGLGKHGSGGDVGTILRSENVQMVGKQQRTTRPTRTRASKQQQQQ